MGGKWFRGIIASLLIVCVPSSSVTAGMIRTEKVVADMAAERERIRDFVQREDVQQRIVALGVTPEEASARVASLSNAEVTKISEYLDRMPAGGDGIYIGLGGLILVAILLVLLLRR